MRVGTPPKLIGVSSERPLSAGSISEMPLSPPMVTSLPGVPLPPRTRSSSRGRGAEIDRRTAVAPVGLMLGRHAASLSRLSSKSSNLAAFESPAAFFVGIGVLAFSSSWMSLSAKRMSLSVMIGPGSTHGDHRARGAQADWPSDTSLNSTSPLVSSRRAAAGRV